MSEKQSGRVAWASRQEVADYLNMTSKTLAQWASKGVGSPYVRVHGRARYRWVDVEAWLATQPTGGEQR